MNTTMKGPQKLFFDKYVLTKGLSRVCTLIIGASSTNRDTRQVKLKQQF